MKAGGEGEVVVERAGWGAASTLPPTYSCSAP